MSFSFVHPTSFALGYHLSSPYGSEEHEQIGYHHLRKFLNITNAFGWIPLVGVITGFARLYLLQKQPEPVYGEDFKQFREIQRARAWCEIGGVGIVFAFLDLIATAGREIEIALGKSYHPT